MPIRCASRLCGHALARQITHLVQHGRTGAVPEIAEALAWKTRCAIALEQGHQCAHHPLPRYQVSIRCGQTCALEIAAYVNRVLVERAADERDVGGVGSGAAIRTAGHSPRQLFPEETETPE